MLASIVTPAEIEHRRLVARHLFDALSAQYPNKYVALVLPRNEADDVPDLTVPKSEG
jgi:hypothetical protein